MQPLQEVINAFKKLSQQKQTAIAGILGALVSESAATPLHWIYKRDVLEGIVGNKNPEFFEENKNPFYQVEKGQHSPYGDTLINGISTLSNYSSNPQTKDYIANLCNSFEPENCAYQVALKNRLAYKQKLQETQGSWDTPVKGPWMNGSMITFFKNINQTDQSQKLQHTGDPESMDSDGFCLALPLALYQLSETGAFSSEQIHRIEDVTKVLNQNSNCLAFEYVQLRLLEQIFQQAQKGQFTYDTLGVLAKTSSQNNQVMQSATTVFSRISEKYIDSVDFYGKACPHPGNFSACLHLTLQAFHQDNKISFVDGVRQNIMAGGDNCSRAVFIGAALGMKDGLDGIPLEWISQISEIDAILKEIHNIFVK